ncbi:hypothetical protein [Ureaplasma zalophigenitalium]|uniref:Sigma-70 family RNA polymerase sigma factor n=1 Tax=Ureaplasma zalophigenitalium TaxID=907723 RepID=A0ABT3BNX3_9BACT|nr:hypothetical protein [Ureaplasma zalophigenitalium]MCV3753945.1 hypothetical protein [Ureaplasma zalophigenitalium]
MLQGILFLINQNDQLVVTWFYRRFYKMFFMYIGNWSQNNAIKNSIKLEEYASFVYQAIKKGAKSLFEQKTNWAMTLGFMKKCLYYSFIDEQRRNQNSKNKILSNCIPQDVSYDLMNLNDSQNDFEQMFWKNFYEKSFEKHLQLNHPDLYTFFLLIKKHYNVEELAKSFQKTKKQIYNLIQKLKKLYASFIYL